MSRPKLPDGAARLKLSLTLSPDAVAALDRVIAAGIVATRSAAVERAVWASETLDEAAAAAVRPRKRGRR